MKYINKITGAEIETICEISGKDWKAVEKKSSKGKSKGKNEQEDKNPDNAIPPVEDNENNGVTPPEEDKDNE